MSENLWAPWRMQYLRQLEAQERAGRVAGSGCFLCEAAATPADSDAGRDRLILLSDARGVVLLNRFPYTNGHLLVAPREHVGELSSLPQAARADLMELTTLAEQLLRTALEPQGLNIGINLGRCAGAGLPGHVHVHLVPRWAGDTNFMPVFGHVRVIPQALEESHAHLAAVLSRMTDERHG